MTMTAKEMIPAVGQQVLARFESLSIPVTVQDVRHVWGKPQLQITPINGHGSQWVELGRIHSLPNTGTALELRPFELG